MISYTGLYLYWMAPQLLKRKDEKKRVGQKRRRENLANLARKVRKWEHYVKIK